MIYTFFSEEIISLEEIEGIFSKIKNYNIDRVVVFDSRHRSLIQIVKDNIAKKLISNDTLIILNAIWSNNNWHFTHDLQDIALTLGTGSYDLAIINNDFLNKKSLLEIRRTVSSKDLIMIKWSVNRDKIEVLKKIMG
ncbi:MAG: hypothetical protein ACOZAJ_01465 [Patescibacteria group bacterium]